MEEATRLAGLRSGRIDFLGFPAGVSDLVSADVLDSLRKTDPEIDLVPWWDRSENSVALDTTKPPFDDIRVRKAMQIALDLQTINDTYYKGTAMWKPQGPVGKVSKGTTRRLTSGRTRSRKTMPMTRKERGSFWRKLAIPMASRLPWSGAVREIWGTLK